MVTINFWYRNDLITEAEAKRLGEAIEFMRKMRRFNFKHTVRLKKASKLNDNNIFLAKIPEKKLFIPTYLTGIQSLIINKFHNLFCFYSCLSQECFA